MSAYKGATGSCSQSICKLTVPCPGSDPTHDVNDVMSEGWPQHRGLRALLFSNSGAKELIKLVPQMDSITSKPPLTKTATEGSHLYIVVCVEMNIRI